jgi:hypothetical protein
MSPQQEALEAAKLATMIGSQLKTVDQLSIGGSTPANRININEFIGCVNNPNARITNKFAQPPPGFAAPIPEEVIQSQIQYTPLVIPTQQVEQVEQQHQNQPISIPETKKQPIIVQNQKIEVDNTNSKNNLAEDIASIKKSVDQLNKNLVRLVDIIRNKK